MWKPVADDTIALRAALPEHLRALFDRHLDAVTQEMARVRLEHPTPPVVRRPQHSGWHYVDVEHDGVLWKWGERAGGTVGSRGWELFEAVDVVTGKPVDASTPDKAAARRASLARAKAASDAFDEAPPAAPPPPPPPPAEPTLRDAVISLPPGWVAEYVEGRETWLIENESDSNEQVKLRYWSKPEPHYYVTSAKESNRHPVGASPSDTAAVRAEKDAAARAAALADAARMIDAFEQARRNRPLTSGRRVWITDVLDGDVLHEANFRGYYEGKAVVVLTKTGMQISVDPSRIRREGPAAPPPPPPAAPPAEPERIVGGRADGRHPDEFDPVALARGIEIEREHTNDPAVAREIAMDHLAEHPDYYDEKRGLPAMEERLSADEAAAEPPAVAPARGVLSDEQWAIAPAVAGAERTALARLVERVIENHYEAEWKGERIYLSHDDGEDRALFRLMWNAVKVGDAVYLRIRLAEVPPKGTELPGRSGMATGEVEVDGGVEAEEQVLAVLTNAYEDAVGVEQPTPAPTPAAPRPRPVAQPGQTWSDPAFADPAASTEVVTEYMPAAAVESGGEYYAVTWYGTLTGPDAGERDPYFATPMEQDFSTLAKAKQAVERAFAKRHPGAPDQTKAEGLINARERNALRWIALGNPPTPALLRPEPPHRESVIGSLRRKGLIEGAGPTGLTVTPAGERALAGEHPAAGRRASSAPVPADPALRFLTRFRHRDAIRNVTREHEITGPMVEEVMWELGYEREPYPFTGHAECEAWARGLGADPKRAWAEGGRARAGAA